MVWKALASYPGALSLGKRAWYPLFAHARDFPAFRGPRISLCDVRSMMTSFRIHGCIINCVRNIIIMATRVEDLDRSISYALHCLGCSATTLKPNHRVTAKFIYEGKDVFRLVLASHYGFTCNRSDPPSV